MWVNSCRKLEKGKAKLIYALNIHTILITSSGYWTLIRSFETRLHANKISLVSNSPNVLSYSSVSLRVMHYTLIQIQTEHSDCIQSTYKLKLSTFIDRTVS